MSTATLSAPAPSPVLSDLPDANENVRTYLRLTRGHDLSCQAGRLTLAQAAELMDAVSCVKTVCSHVFALNGHEMPDRYRETLAEYGLKSSLASARAMLALWNKWTHQLDTSACPFVSSEAVRVTEGFIWALRNR